MKNSRSFHISAQNIDCRYLLEPQWRGGSNEYPNLCFRAEIRKLLFSPVNPKFTVQKWGLRVKTIQACFRDDQKNRRKKR